MDYSISAILSAIGKVLFTVVTVLWLKKGLLGTVISLFAASTISFIFILLSTKIYQLFDCSAFDRELLKRMLQYSWPMVPNSLSAWIMRVSDRFVVAAFLGIEAQAVYAVANKIPSILTLAQSTFTLAWQENASIASKDDDASDYYTSVFGTLFNLMAGFFGILISVTPILYKLLIRGDYSDSYNQIPVLFLAIFFFSMSTFLGGIYVAYKKATSVGITTAVAAAINLLVDLGLINYIGLYAASVSTLVSYVFLFIYRMIDVQKIVAVKYNIKHILFVIMVMVLESVLCFMQKPVLNVINVIIGFSFFAIANRTFSLNVLKKIKSFLRSRR